MRRLLSAAEEEQGRCNDDDKMFHRLVMPTTGQVEDCIVCCLVVVWLTQRLLSGFRVCGKHYFVICKYPRGHFALLPGTSPTATTAQAIPGCWIIHHLPVATFWRCNQRLWGRISLEFREGGEPILENTTLPEFPDGESRLGDRITTGIHLLQGT